MQSINEADAGNDARECITHSSFVASPVLTEANNTGQSTPSNELDQDTINNYSQVRTAYYNAVSERSLSHEEAKLFYQRHQLERSQLEPDDHPSLSRARTLPSASSVNEGLSGIGRTALHIKCNGDRNWRLPPGSGPKLPSAPLHIPDLPDTEEEPNSSLDHPDVPGDESSAQNLSLGSDTDVPPMTGPDISPELSAISANIKKVLDSRHKFINLSLQGPSDNPKDRPDWKIYPSPPNPTWDTQKNQISSSTGPICQEESSVMTDRESSNATLPVSSTVKPRKPGQNVGEDFDMSELFPLPGNDETISYHLDGGSVYQIYRALNASLLNAPLIQVPTLREFYKEMDEIQKISSDGPTKSFAYRQLDILEGRFHLYFLVNSYQETADCKKVPHRDFYNVRKVDTHVHHSACMNQKHLLRFIKSKMKKSPGEIVMFRDNKELTLKQVFESINLTAFDLSIDTLDMHVGVPCGSADNASKLMETQAHTDSFHRFDKFNLKYNPIGESRLREIFLKTDNYIKGRYLAEITKEVISDLESSKYQFVEWRVSIYGRSIDEWDKLAAWVIDNKLISHNVRWLVQIPRLYSLYKANNQMESYEEIIINIFQPLYEVTMNPSKYAKLHVFLQRVIGFDSVDDESKAEVRLYRRYPPPKEWSTKQNPPYTYWIYHLFANMASLNHWRQRRGFNTFVLRPHCGEAGDVDHIAAAVLCCHSISHGLLLRKVPLLQYIFYLDQIGIAMSPLSNNALFLAYDRNPFLKYFKRGLNVSLSTDDPLQFAFTKEPLIEEYSVAAQIYRLSATDMCELAHHSVIQSGFEHELKQRWLGPNYHLQGVDGNNVAKSNVPDIREKFRSDTLMEELSMLNRYAAASGPGPVMWKSAQKLSSPYIAMHSATSPSFQSRFTTSRSNLDLEGLEMEHNAPATRPIPRSSSMIMSPSQMHPAGYGRNGTLSSPRIFPGVVHERTRRGSLRQGSSSERDISTLDRPVSMTWEQNVKGGYP